MSGMVRYKTEFADDYILYAIVYLYIKTCAEAYRFARDMDHQRRNHPSGIPPKSTYITGRNIKGRPFWSRVWVFGSIPTERNALNG